MTELRFQFGKVKYFNRQRGYGFFTAVDGDLQAASSEDVWFHIRHFTPLTVESRRLVFDTRSTKRKRDIENDELVVFGPTYRTEDGLRTDAWSTLDDFNELSRQLEGMLPMIRVSQIARPVDPALGETTRQGTVWSGTDIAKLSVAYPWRGIDNTVLRRDDYLAPWTAAGYTITYQFEQQLDDDTWKEIADPRIPDCCLPQDAEFPREWVRSEHCMHR